MLLRAGAQVIVTTRFPRDAAERYARETDFATWKDRLEVHGLDLRHSPSVELFARYLAHPRPRLDVLINNAARRCAGHRPCTPTCSQARAGRRLRPAAGSPRESRGLYAALASARCDRRRACRPRRASGFSRRRGGIGMTSAELSVSGAYDDGRRRPSTSPRPARRRPSAGRLAVLNSWRLTLSEVQTPEMLEVHLVNAVAPFIL